MSQTITLKDKNYHIIGYVEIKDNGDKTLKDERYHIVGYYDAKANITRNERFQIVGYGDLLTSLL